MLKKYTKPILVILSISILLATGYCLFNEHETQLNIYISEPSLTAEDLGNLETYLQQKLQSFKGVKSSRLSLKRLENELSSSGFTVEPLKVFILGVNLTLSSDKYKHSKFLHTEYLPRIASAIFMRQLDYLANSIAVKITDSQIEINDLESKKNELNDLIAQIKKTLSIQNSNYIALPNNHTVINEGGNLSNNPSPEERSSLNTNPLYPDEYNFLPVNQQYYSITTLVTKNTVAIKHTSLLIQKLQTYIKDIQSLKKRLSSETLSAEELKEAAGNVLGYGKYLKLSKPSIYHSLVLSSQSPNFSYVYSNFNSRNITVEFVKIFIFSTILLSFSAFVLNILALSFLKRGKDV